jgi:uracil-DNA glycosylase family 4
MRLVQQGPRDAKIVLVGEAPGATEEMSGVPFSGGAGVVLNDMLSHVGIRRDECFVTNVCHVRPPDNDFAWFLKPKPRPEFIYGVVQLKTDLEAIRPNLAVCLGGRALKVLAGKDSIDKWRGSILESTLVKGLKVIGTYHPAYVLRVWDYKAVAELDLRRCQTESAFADVRLPSRNLALDPPREQLGPLVSELLAADWLSVDIECIETERGWKLSCVGFSDHADRAVTIACDEQWKLDYIKLLCESSVRKVLQNGTFDATVLGENGIILQNFAWDTMLAHHSIYPECASGTDELSQMGGKKRHAAIAKGLAFLTSVYTRQPFYKDDGKLWHATGDLQLFYRYNSLDAAVTREIRDVQEREIAEFGTESVFEHEMLLVRPLMDATRRGIRINLPLRQRLKAEYEAQIQRLQAFLDQAAGESVNVKSPPQIQRLLYEKLQLPAKRNRKTRRPTADKDAIIELAGKYNHPVLASILAIRKRRDFVERYLNAAVDADGRMRCSFDITGTRTGRLSSRQSIYGSGTNLYNIPIRSKEGEAIRRMFLADEGKVLIARDCSQAEARVVAWLARCEGLIELFSDPTRDIHTENAARINEIPLPGVSAEQRYLAKKAVHAFNYGMFEDRMVQLVNEDSEMTGVRIDSDKARMIRQKYFMLYPEIQQNFWREVERELRRTRTLITPFGRKRQFFGRMDDKLLREAYAFIPQSTVGDLVNRAIIRLHSEVVPRIPGLEFILSVYDSIIVQCWEKDVEQVAEELARVMAIPITIHGRTFVIPTDCKVGYNWGSQNDENTQGLRKIEKWGKP